MRLFEKPKNGGVENFEFPNLFAMQAFTGLFGLSFSLIWFYVAAQTIPNLIQNSSPKLSLWVGLICAGFILLAIISVSIVIMSTVSLLRPVSNEDQEAAEPKQDQEDVESNEGLGDKFSKNARIWIVVLSLGYIFLCCSLIWLTGGGKSPFTPFYAMIFTLTIQRCTLPFPGYMVLLGFTVPFFIAAGYFKLFGSLILVDDLTTILDSDPQYFMYTGFVIGSLAVPTISQHVVEILKKYLPEKISI